MKEEYQLWLEELNAFLTNDFLEKNQIEPERLYRFYQKGYDVEKAGESIILEEFARKQKPLGCRFEKNCLITSNSFISQTKS